MIFSKKRGVSIAVWSVVLLLVAAACYYYVTQLRSSKEKVSYETAPITKGNVSSKVTATGNLQAVTQITVGSQVSGIIQNLYVDFNTRVRKGQPLAQLDPSTLRAQVEQTTASVNNAMANLANQQANVANQAANIRSADAAILSAQAKYQQALAAFSNSRAALNNAKANQRRGEADYQLAVRNQKRQETLRKRDLIATSDLDTAATTSLTARANVDSLVAQVDSAEANLRSAQANVDAARADVDAARIRREAAVQQKASAEAQVQGATAQVSQARANQRQAQVNLDFATIRSPIDGIVLDRKVTIGQTVAATFQAPDLFTMAENLEQLKVQTSVDEADIGQVKEGAHATFTIDAFPNQRFEGEVSEVHQAPVTTNNVVTYVVIIQTSNPDGKLKPGMTATVNIWVESREDVLLIPNSALRFRPADASGGNGKEKRRRKEGDAKSSKDGKDAKDSKDSKDGEGGKEGRRGRRGGRRSVTVYTLDPNDPAKLVEHRVTPGITDGTNTEVLKSDLKEGDQVVTGSDSPGSSSSGPRSGGSGGGKGGAPKMRFF